MQGGLSISKACGGWFAEVSPTLHITAVLLPLLPARMDIFLFVPTNAFQVLFSTEMCYINKNRESTTEGLECFFWHQASSGNQVLSGTSWQIAGFKWARHFCPCRRRGYWVSEVNPDSWRSTAGIVPACCSGGCPDAHRHGPLLLGHLWAMASLHTMGWLCGGQGGWAAVSQPAKPGEPELHWYWATLGRSLGLPTEERAPALCTSSSSLQAVWVLAGFSPLHPPDYNHLKNRWSSIDRFILLLSSQPELLGIANVDWCKCHPKSEKNRHPPETISLLMVTLFSFCPISSFFM